MELAEQKPTEPAPKPWLYMHPMVQEAAKSDDRLASHLEALARLEEALQESPDNEAAQNTFFHMRTAVEENCRSRFYLLAQSLEDEG